MTRQLSLAALFLLALAPIAREPRGDAGAQACERGIHFERVD